MTKTPLATLVAGLLVGTVAGTGGYRLAVRPTPAPFVRAHKVDLSAVYLPDGGMTVLRFVYGTEVKSDGGTRDVNGTADCATPSSRRDEMRQLMLESAADCTWNNR